MSDKLISVVIPAHNEEKQIAKCLCSIRTASMKLPEGSVEMIIIADRCTDRTEEIARDFDCLVVKNNNEMTLSALINMGVLVASGKILLILSPDCRISDYTLIEIHQMLRTRKYIGGGMFEKPERLSAGILASSVYETVLNLPEMMRKKSPVFYQSFWCLKKVFNEMGGFNETLTEDCFADFVKRLKVYGESVGKKYTLLQCSTLSRSTRRFDINGDWYPIKENPYVKKAMEKMKG